MEQLYFAGRLGPQPAPIPESIDERIMMFGLINEVAGENGLSWCKRLIMLHLKLPIDFNQDPTQTDIKFARALSLFHLYQQPARSSRLEHPPEENDGKDEVDHVQFETPFEMQCRKPPSFDSLPHTFE